MEMAMSRRPCTDCVHCERWRQKKGNKTRRTKHRLGHVFVVFKSDNEDGSSRPDHIPPDQTVIWFKKWTQWEKTSQ